MHAPIPGKLKTAATATLAAILIMAALLLNGATGASGQSSGLTAQVPENSNAGTSLGTPLETAAPATYSLSGADAALFNIDPDTGEITLAQGASPDFESRTEYSVTVTASAALTVQVTNLDEAGSITLSTGSPESGQSLTASFTDPDGGVSNVGWQWQRQETDHWHDIADANGADYTPGTGDIGHRLQAVATYDDAQGPGKSAQAATDNPVRNDPPEFGAEAAERKVDENAPGGASVGEPVAAADPNGDRVSYSLAGSSHFAVNPDSGQIIVAGGAALDFETRASHSLILTAEDSHGDSGQIQVTVNLNNVDEPGTLVLSHEKLRSGATITAALSDPDGNISGETWTWTRSGEAIPGAASGQYTATAADVGHTLAATVRYTDGEGTGKSASATTGKPRPRSPRASGPGTGGSRST